MLAGIFSIIAVVGVVGQLFVGWLADRVRRLPIVAVGTIFTGLMAILQGRATGLSSFATPRVAGTAAVGFAGVPHFSLLSDWYPPEVRGRTFSFYSTFTLIGTLPIGGFLVAAYGWRNTAVLVGILLVVLGGAVLLLKEPVRGYFEKQEMGLVETSATQEDPPQSFGEAWRSTFAVRTLRRVFIAEILIGVGTAPLNFLRAFFLADQYNLDVFGRSLVSLAPVVAAVAGAFIGGGLMDVFNRRSPGSVLRLCAVFLMLSFLGNAALAFSPPLWLAVGFISLATFGLVLTGPSFSAIYSQIIPPNIRTQALQITGLAILPGTFFLTAFISIQQNYGYQATFLVCVPFFVLAGLVMVSAADFFEVDKRNALIAAASTEEARQRRAAGDAKLLICRQVNAGYDGTQVLFNVDFEVDEGEIVALLGTNGAGKSTLLRAISGTQQAWDGAVVLDGRDITHMPSHEISARGVAMMPGGRGIFAKLSVEENLALGTWLAAGDQKAQLLRDVYSLFPVLDQRRSQPAELLSGGEQQMLALGMALLAKPKLLLIDELSLGLSPAAVGELIEKVREIHRRGTTIVVVEQSVNVALTLAERAVFMEKGEVRFSGRTEDLMHRPDILRAVYVKGTGGVSVAGGLQSDADRRRRALELDAARPVLEVREINKRFGGVQALDSVSMTLRDGEILGIVGPNGSGKSTLFDLISGHQAADSGHILFAGKDITSLSPHGRGRLGLVRRFQDARIFPGLTVHESVMVALDRSLEVRSGLLGAMQLPGVRRAERRLSTKADRILDILELTAYRDKFVKELSTGLRRITDLAFVLAAEPKVLLLDEPSSGIAQAEAEGLGPLLLRVRHETGCSILIIEHDIPLITRMSDELIAMVSGRVVTRGSASEVLDNSLVQQAFLGTDEAAKRRSGVLV